MMGMRKAPLRTSACSAGKICLNARSPVAPKKTNASELIADTFGKRRCECRVPVPLAELGPGPCVPDHGKASRMNYRHAYHAGNFADVFKHAMLVWVVRYLQQKPRPICLID